MTSTYFGFPTETVVVFITIISAALFIDLFLYRKEASITLKTAMMWSVFWISIAIVFFLFLYEHHGSEIAYLFFISYIMEEILSIDNLFMIMMIFTWFDIPDIYRHRVLHLGITGVIIFRGIFVAISASLLNFGPYMEIVFALIISLTAMITMKNSDSHHKIEDYSQHLAYRLLKQFYPIWPKIIGNFFILSQNEVDNELNKIENKDILIGRVKKAKFYATPLLLCVIVIEIFDAIFAFDSVPAITAMSREPLIIYSSMIFAVLGLRTLYFILEKLKKYFMFFKRTALLLLFFVSFKLILNATNYFLHHGYYISRTTSLFAVLLILITNLFMSTFIYKHKVKKIKD